MNEAILTKHKQIVGRHIAAENAHELGATLATLHPQCVFEDIPLARAFHGHAGAEQYYRLWWCKISSDWDHPISWDGDHLIS